MMNRARPTAYALSSKKKARLRRRRRRMYLRFILYNIQMCVQFMCIYRSFNDVCARRIFSNIKYI